MKLMVSVKIMVLEKVVGVFLRIWCVFCIQKRHACLRMLNDGDQRFSSQCILIINDRKL